MIKWAYQIGTVASILYFGIMTDGHAAEKGAAQVPTVSAGGTDAAPPPPPPSPAPGPTPPPPPPAPPGPDPTPTPDPTHHHAKPKPEPGPHHHVGPSPGPAHHHHDHKPVDPSVAKLQADMEKSIEEDKPDGIAEVLKKAEAAKIKGFINTSFKKGKERYTFLLYAIAHKKVKAIEALVKAKANVNQAGTLSVGHGKPRKLTPLMAAARTGQLHVVDNLITVGAKTDIKSPSGATFVNWMLDVDPSGQVSVSEDAVELLEQHPGAYRAQLNSKRRCSYFGQVIGKKDHVYIMKVVLASYDPVLMKHAPNKGVGHDVKVDLKEMRGTDGKTYCIDHLTMKKHIGKHHYADDRPAAVGISEVVIKK